MLSPLSVALISFTQEKRWDESVLLIFPFLFLHYYYCYYYCFWNIITCEHSIICVQHCHYIRFITSRYTRMYDRFRSKPHPHSLCAFQKVILCGILLIQMFGLCYIINVLYMCVRNMQKTSAVIVKSVSLSLITSPVPTICILITRLATFLHLYISIYSSWLNLYFVSNEIFFCDYATLEGLLS